MASSYVSQLVSWRDNLCDVRGTYDIFSLCASTLVICAWSAVHVDLPRRRTFWSTHGARVAWFIVGIFFPEILLSLAYGQFLAARRISAHSRRFFPRRDSRSWAPEWLPSFESLCGTRNRSDNSQSSGLPHQDQHVFPLQALPSDPCALRFPQRKNEWTMTHSFYVLMGGFPVVEDPHLLPDVSANYIMDLSKTGPLAKGILVAQILFFCANCAARVNQRLPLSLLEVTTAAHALCALGAYVLWWYKPQDVSGEAPSRTKVDSLRQLFETLFYSYSSTWKLIPSTVIIALLYGCPHLLGLHVLFPTDGERIMWSIATTLVIVCPTLEATLVYLFDHDRTTPGLELHSLGWTQIVILATLMMLYVLASVYLVGESVRQLFALPEGAFVETQWTRYIPHVS